MLHCVGQKRQVALQLVTFAIRQTVGMAGISNQRDDVGNAGAQSLRRWAMANHLRAELVLDAMEMAVGQRRPKDVIHHSDQGSQYTSVAFGKRCGEAGVRPSMGSVGDAYDNAMAEIGRASCRERV